MSGRELRTLRTRHGMTLQNVAYIVKLKQISQIWHWEHETYPIPARHQVTLRHLFMELGRRHPPVDACPYCRGTGLSNERTMHADTQRSH